MEDNIYALLEEVNLPLEFWDEATKVDYYIRNHIYNKLKLDSKRVYPE
jgi:hypothetical protein